MLFGIGLVTQMRSREYLNERLEAQSERDLVEIVDRLDGELGLMRSELNDAQVKLAAFKNIKSDEQEAVGKITDEIRKLKAVLGDTPAHGSGIRIKIKDNQRLLLGFDIRQIVEELRSSGGWAVSVNDIRLSTDSSFWRRSGKVYLSGVPLGPEYEIKAVGDAALLYQAVTLPSGIRDKLRTVKGVTVSVKRIKRMILPARRTYN